MEPPSEKVYTAIQKRKHILFSSIAVSLRTNKKRLKTHKFSDSRCFIQYSLDDNPVSFLNALENANAF